MLGVDLKVAEDSFCCTLLVTIVTGPTLIQGEGQAKGSTAWWRSAKPRYRSAWKVGGGGVATFGEYLLQSNKNVG